MASYSLTQVRDLTSNEIYDASTSSGAAGALALIILSTVMLCVRMWSRLVASQDRLW